MYQLIGLHKKRVQESFPNMEIALRMHLSGDYDQQLERGAFILKDEADQEQTSDIDVHAMIICLIVLHGAQEHRIGHSA